MYALLWAVAPLLGWNEYVPEATGTYCSIDWLSRRTSDKTYTTLIFLFAFVIPVFVIIYCYTAVWLKVKQVYLYVFIKSICPAGIFSICNRRA